MLRDIKACLGITEALLSHIQPHSELCITIIQNPVFFRTIHPCHYSEPCHSKNLRHLEKPVEHVRWLDIFRTLAWSEQFIKDIQGYWYRFIPKQLGKGEGRLPLRLLGNWKKCFVFQKKDVDWVHLWRKKIKMWGQFFLCFCTKCL